MSFGDRWREIRTGFERSFWVANFTELFERLAYYGLQAVLAISLHAGVGLSEAQSAYQGNSASTSGLGLCRGARLRIGSASWL